MEERRDARHGKHDPAVASVELAETETLFTTPRMPYTEALLSAVPRPNPRLRDTGRRIVLEGEIPSPVNPPTGCPFHTRCRYAEARCRTETPALREVAPGHFAGCHFAEQLSLRGVEATAATPAAD
jgi:peptide/nickel transport system ATP-binding protein